MTSDENAMPPALAERLLPLLLTPANRDSVPGDLLEEYRESVRPTRGTRRADIWYVKQVAGFLWRLSFPWAVWLCAAFLVRQLFDIFAPPATLMGYGPRSAVTTWVAIGTFVALGFQAAYRTGRVRTAAIVSTASSVIGHVIALPFNLILFFGIIQRDPVVLWRFNATGGLSEGLVLAPVTLVIGAVLALGGGVAGRLARRLSGASKSHLGST